MVYTYSKGLETLLLPISGLPSYGFFLSFQIWMTIGVLIASGQIVELFVGRRYAVGCMALLSCIPGIMNMSITAKTDSMTVFMQLVMLLFLLLYIRRQRSDYLILAVDAYLMTLVLKPTALVFSTAAAGTVGLYILFTKQLKFKIQRKAFCRHWALWFRCGFSSGTLDMASHGSPLTICVQLDLGGSWIYRTIPISVREPSVERRIIDLGGRTETHLKENLRRSHGPRGRGYGPCTDRLGHTNAPDLPASGLPADSGGCEKVETEREKYVDLSGIGICDERIDESRGTLPVMAGGRQLFSSSLRPVSDPGDHSCGKIKE